MAPRTIKTARAGEDYIANQLKTQNWTILARNFRHIGTELDIVAAKSGTLIAVEVKTRSAGRPLPNPDTLLNPRKMQALSKGIKRFLATSTKGSFETIRLDLALVGLCPKGKVLTADYITNLTEEL